MEWNPVVETLSWKRFRKYSNDLLILPSPSLRFPFLSWPACGNLVSHNILHKIYKTPPSQTKNRERWWAKREEARRLRSPTSALSFPGKAATDPPASLPHAVNNLRNTPAAARALHPPSWPSPQTSILPLSSDRAPNKLRLREKLPPPLTLV